MIAILPSETLIQALESSESAYMADRMTAIRNRPGNPEGVEMERFGSALCLYSKSMPWPAFNTVKGLTSADIDFVDPILDFYRARGRKAQVEIVPSRADRQLLERLSSRGLYQSGFHTSLYADPAAFHEDERQHVTVRELREDQFHTYATIHCRGTGLADNGITPVAENNKVLFHRPGWTFFIAYVEEEPAATAVMFSQDGIASFTFAATLPQFRGQGLHGGLLARRLLEAKRQHCRLAVSQCSLLSQSHRNMERAGMRIGYVKATWTEQ
ncbi:GNAT family N-acetyltransferase [Paenibacillus ginsengarvi]|uniref:GNAT family N-acetyltransferase n=1 Tax=Paenibacillus ginsengarvi TaxID=400777 RepID=UPI001874C392|nr:GNAT family N-acetyltransferase [Paenibacillus ginsengarvi]